MYSECCIYFLLCHFSAQQIFFSYEMMFANVTLAKLEDTAQSGSTARSKAFSDIPFQDSRKEFHHFIKNYQLSKEAHWLSLGKAAENGVQKIGHFLENRWNETSHSKINFLQLFETQKSGYIDTSFPAPPYSLQWDGWSRGHICSGSFGSQFNPRSHPLTTSLWPNAVKQLTT